MIAIAGPTGAGKSDFAARLGLRVGGEVVCADAFQIYVGMGILTAQPGEDFLSMVPHHLFGVIPPDVGFDAARYATLATEKLEEIHSRGRIPILVGGTGLYFQAVFGGLDPLPPPDLQLRSSLSQKPLGDLLAQLQTLDPHAMETIDIKNPRRVTRALEIVIQTGRPLSDSRRAQSTMTHHKRGLILNRDREELKIRITQNVESQFARGVIEEVEALRNAGATAAQAIGFEEICRFLDGEISREDALQAMVLASCRYAKRQLTWFRNRTSYQEIILSNHCPPDHLTEEAFSLLAFH